MKNNYDINGPDSPHFDVTELDQPSESETLAWEEVDRGRYMPRRVRGSCQGRALG